MKQFLRRTWTQLGLVYGTVFLVVWIGIRYTAASDLASTLLVASSVLFSVAFTVYTSFRSGKFSTRPQWWLDFATDKKYRAKTDRREV